MLPLQDFLRDFWPELRAAHELYSSVSQALQEKVSEGSQREYAEHLHAKVLEAGIKAGRYIQGTLNISKHHNEAMVTTDGLSNKDTDLSCGVLVWGIKNRNRATHGDTVVAELLPRSEWQGRVTALAEGDGDESESKTMPTGRVVGILQRNWRDYVVTFPPRDGTQPQSRNSKHILTVPWDRRIPKIRISTQQADALQVCCLPARSDGGEPGAADQSGALVSSRITGWWCASTPGRAPRSIQTDTPCECWAGPESWRPRSRPSSWRTAFTSPPSQRHRSERRFPSFGRETRHPSSLFCSQLREMPVNSPERPWRVDAAQVAARRDLRESRLVFSIDPRGCEDVDDTLSVHRLDGGAALELGVHIADVTHFVAEGSLTDVEARLRATTYYLADRRYDMLPPVLSSDLCSLLGGVDRYAMSVIWQLDAHTLAVRDVWFGRTIIRSSYQLHYELAQALLNGEPAEVPELAALRPEEKDAKLAKLTQALEMLTQVARHLRARRDRGGALELEGMEVQAQLDKDKNITALVPRQPLEVHETVAECMIYANHWVARKIQEAFPHQALLRRHPPPRQEFFSQLVDSATARGFTISTRSNKDLAESLDQAVDPQDALVNRLLRMMATSAMSQALYFSTGLQPQDQYYHYGLALDRYTHFTSPIRRYADMVVHRLLTAAVALEEGKDPGRALASNRELEELAQHINQKNRAADAAQKLSTIVFQCLYFKERDPQTDPRCTADAIIYSIKNDGVLVFVPEYGVKGPVYLKNREGQVVSVGPDGACQWKSGSIQKHSDHIISSSGSSATTFRLFDHITVRISVQSTPFHADCLKLEVINNKPHLSSEPQQHQPQGRNQLVQEVVRLAEEASQQAQERAKQAKLSREERQFSQSKTPNLYSLLEEVRELALMDLDTSAQRCAATA
ncbi:hypothetical protein fugu_002880 [Takifugu bimaculatus]|uniref:DIS3-like exonuclease 1 n=1 Tax=Takifugu bimaculatus TaxID=433685 RepID=A0A4Z2BDU0_9TELE|nr:hypothetical protein fugu_002880 [Takifugu bimaculatus]